MASNLNKEVCIYIKKERHGLIFKQIYRIWNAKFSKNKNLRSWKPKYYRT